MQYGRYQHSVNKRIDPSHAIMQVFFLRKCLFSPERSLYEHHIEHKCITQSVGESVGELTNVIGNVVGVWEIFGGLKISACIFIRKC